MEHDEETEGERRLFELPSERCPPAALCLGIAATDDAFDLGAALASAFM